MKTKVLLPIFLIVMSLVLAACGEATRRPSVEVNLSETFLATPGTVYVDVLSSDNSLGKAPQSCSFSVKAESAANPITMEITPKSWTGFVIVSETTTVTADCANEAGHTTESQTVTIANPSSSYGYFDDSGSWDTIATLQNACVATGGREVDNISSLKSMEWGAIINRESLENGFTLQAYHEEIAPSFTNVFGYTIPHRTLEDGNDGAQTLSCLFNNTLYTWVFDRKGQTKVPFYHISAWKLNADHSVTVWYNDDSGPGGFDGNGSGDSHTYYLSDAFTSLSDASAYVDEYYFNTRIARVHDLETDLGKGFFTLPQYAEIVMMWQNK